jgi:hypothetical protein
MDTRGNEVIDIITKMKKEWMQAWIDKNKEKFKDILAEDFLLSSARGVFMNKQEWIDGAMNTITATNFE